MEAGFPFTAILVQQTLLGINDNSKSLSLSLIWYHEREVV
jgi:hypothetical protein